MIELRWVERKPEEGLNRMPGVRDDIGVNRILQYRQIEHPPIGEESFEKWSDWKDVPFVAAV